MLTYMARGVAALCGGVATNVALVTRTTDARAEELIGESKSPWVRGSIVAVTKINMDCCVTRNVKAM